MITHYNGAGFDHLIGLARDLEQNVDRFGAPKTYALELAAVCRDMAFEAMMSAAAIAELKFTGRTSWSEPRSRRRFEGENWCGTKLKLPSLPKSPISRQSSKYGTDAPDAEWSVYGAGVSWLNSGDTDGAEMLTGFLRFRGGFCRNGWLRRLGGRRQSTLKPSDDLAAPPVIAGVSTVVEHNQFGETQVLIFRAILQTPDVHAPAIAEQLADHPYANQFVVVELRVPDDRRPLL